MPPTTQKALIVPSIGSRVISVSDWPIPLPGPNQLQIRITAASLNPHDQKVRGNGAFIPDSFPVILGHDLAGIVTKTGSAVTKAANFAIGDRVFSQSKLFETQQGHEQKALQEFAVVDEAFTSKIPGSSQDAAALPTNIMASVIGLFDPEVGLGIPAPWTERAKTFDYGAVNLLIVGGGSNCGKLAVQLAGGLVGVGKVIVVGGDERELKGWGAASVLGRFDGEEEILRSIREVLKGEEFLFAFDTVNSPGDQHLAISALSSGGTLARLRFSGGSVDEGKVLGERKFERKAGEDDDEGREGAWYRLQNVLGLSHLRPETAKPFWERIGGYLRDGKISAPRYEVVEGLDAEKVNEVLDRYRDGEKVVQIHFRISEE